MKDLVIGKGVATLGTISRKRRDTNAYGSGGDGLNSIKHLNKFWGLIFKILLPRSSLLLRQIFGYN